MKRTAYLALIVSLAVTSAAWAENRGSADDQLACTPDVYRLCSSYIPDEDAITACLEQHKPDLSQGCRAVFSRPVDAAKPKAPDDD